MTVLGLTRRLVLDMRVVDVEVVVRGLVVEVGPDLASGNVVLVWEENTFVSQVLQAKRVGLVPEIALVPSNQSFLSNGR